MAVRLRQQLPVIVQPLVHVAPRRCIVARSFPKPTVVCWVAANSVAVALAETAAVIGASVVVVLADTANVAMPVFAQNVA